MEIGDIFKLARYYSKYGLNILDIIKHNAVITSEGCSHTPYYMCRIQDMVNGNEAKIKSYNEYFDVPFDEMGELFSYISSLDRRILNIYNVRKTNNNFSSWIRERIDGWEGKLYIYGYSIKKLLELCGYNNIKICLEKEVL